MPLAKVSTQASVRVTPLVMPPKMIAQLLFHYHGSCVGDRRSCTGGRQLSPRGRSAAAVGVGKNPDIAKGRSTGIASAASLKRCWLRSSVTRETLSHAAR